MEFYTEDGKNLSSDNSTLVLVCFLGFCFLSSSTLFLLGPVISFCNVAGAVHRECRAISGGSSSSFVESEENWIFG